METSYKGEFNLKIKDFYELLDDKLKLEITQSEDPIFKKYKQDSQKKSYALLIWF